LEDLVKGNLAGVIMEAQIARTYIRSFYKDKLKIVGLPLTDVSIRLVAHWDKKGEALVDHFNKGLKKVHEDGTFDKLMKKWALSR
jgi:polar amino acid transport system substrate-binding protein